MTAKVYVGDVGTAIELDTTVDISGASSVAIEVKKPDGTTATWSGTVTGTGNTKIRYVTTTGDIDQAGIYFLQAAVTSLSGFTGRGETVRLHVRLNFN